MEVKTKSKSKEEEGEPSYSSEKKCFEGLLKGGPRKCFDNYKEIMEREVRKINPDFLTELRCLALLAQKRESSSYVTEKILYSTKNMAFLSNGEVSNEFYSTFPFLEFVEKTRRGKKKKVVLNRNSLTYLFLFSFLSLKRREKNKNLSVSMVRVVDPNIVNYHKNLLNYNVILLTNKRLKNNRAMLKSARVIDLHNQKEEEILRELEKSLDSKDREEKRQEVSLKVVLEPLRISIFRSLALCYLNYQVAQMLKTSKADVEGFIELVNFINIINKKLLKERKSSSKKKEEKPEDLLIYVPLIALSEKKELKEKIREYEEGHKEERGLEVIKSLEDKKLKLKNSEFEKILSIYNVVYL